MSTTIPYDMPAVGDVWVSVRPDSSETATIIGVKITPNQWQAVLWGGFRNPLRIAQGEGWSSRAQWHPLKDDELLFPKEAPVAPAEPPVISTDTLEKRKRGAV